MRRIISFILCLAFVFCLSSCDDEGSAFANEKMIAVKYGSANEIACEQYIDYTKVTYNSSSDVVLAVENKKANCGIVDEFELIDGNYSHYPVGYCARRGRFLTAGLANTHRCRQRKCEKLLSLRKIALENN